MDADRIDSILSLLKYGGILVGGVSGVLGILTRTHKERPKRKLTAWGWVSLVLTIVGFAVAAGAQYAEASRRKIQDATAKEELRQQREENRRAEQEFRGKFQEVLIQLNAAKQEDSKRITEEKIRVIQKDFSEWADSFVKNQQRIKGELDKVKIDFEQGKLQEQIDEAKKEIQTSQQAFPIISFAIRYVQEAVRAYSGKTGKMIKVEAFELPENLYEKQTDYEIRFSTNAVWKFSVSARRPAGRSGTSSFPSLRIEFVDSQGKTCGTLTVRTRLTDNKFSMTYQASIPTPDPKTIAGYRDFTEYETAIREVFQRVIEAQLVQAVE